MVKVLKSMGDEFLIGLVDLVGGEKDPRNLMIVFSIIKVILVEFDIVKHVEVSTTNYNRKMMLWGPQKLTGNALRIYSFCLMSFIVIFQSHFGHLQTIPTALLHKI